MASRREQILGALAARLQAIQVSGGYATDAGSLVLLGQVLMLGPEDPSAVIAIVPQDDEPRYQGVNLFILWPVEVQAVANAELDDAWSVIEAIVADIKTAVELADRTLGGLVPRQIERGQTRILPREPGTAVVGAAVTYVVPYLEAWGQP